VVTVEEISWKRYRGVAIVAKSSWRRDFCEKIAEEILRRKRDRGGEHTFSKLLDRVDMCRLN
jgi:hypothetical protein